MRVYLAALSHAQQHFYTIVPPSVEQIGKHFRVVFCVSFFFLYHNPQSFTVAAALLTVVNARQFNFVFRTNIQSVIKIIILRQFPPTVERHISTMESTAVNVKAEDTVRVVATADATVTAFDVANLIAVSDAIVPPIKLDKEMIMTTDEVQHVMVSKLAVASNETATTVNATGNDPGVEEDQLRIAMASTTISTNEVDGIKHNLGEKVLNGQQKFATNTNNYFKRPSIKSPISKEKDAQVNPPATAHSNFFIRRPQQNTGGHNQHRNNKQQRQYCSPSVSRGRKFHQHHNSQQYYSNRYLFKGSTLLPSSGSNEHSYDQHHRCAAPTTAGKSRTQRGGGHYQNYSNRQCKYSIIQHVIIFDSFKYFAIKIYYIHSLYLC